MAALVENMYTDNADEKMLRCAVALISSTWAITSSSCTDTNAQPNSLFIRLSSNYWSQDGIVTKVVHVHIFSAISALEFEPFLMDQACITFAVIPDHGMLITATAGHGYVWDSDIGGLPLSKRFKYNKVKQMDVILRNGKGLMKHDETYCDRNYFTPIWDRGNNFLIGIPVQDNCLHNQKKPEVVYEDITYYVDYLLQIGALE